MSTPATPRHPGPPPARRMLAVILLVPLIATLALWSFAWPAARVAPHDVPVGVAGPASATARLERGLAERGDAFETHRFRDAAAARAAVGEREVYGAVVVTPRGPELLTASAASPAVAQLLVDTVSRLAPEGTEPRVTDVVPAPDTDPRGSALGAGVLPLTLAGVVAGALVVLLGLRGIRAVGALVGAAALVGLAVAAVTDSWLGVVTGDWWAEAGVLALTALAGAAAVAGLAALFGRVGLTLGSLLTVLLGNPASGVTTAPELLPEPMGSVGQLLPPGAGGTLLRSVAFFDGHGAGGAALTLAVWTVAGLAAVLLAPLRRGRAGAARDRRTPASPPAI